MNVWPRIVTAWGSDARDHEQKFDCDAVLPEHDLTLFRAVDVEAPAAVTWRWLCQMRVAPYSYDKLDNRGRRSPQELIPGLEQLEVGQRWMQIFRLEAFEPGRSITLFSNGPVFGLVAITYLVVTRGEERSRIVVKIQGRTRRTPLGLLMRLILPPGDLVMMRRQLLNLAKLAERTPLSAVEPGAAAAPAPA
jgi:hypothetical protein